MATRNSVVLLACTAAVLTPAESAPPQKDLKIDFLHGNPHSADFSPDEKLVATESTVTKELRPGVQEFSEVIQLWDFKQDKLVGEVVIHKEEVSASSSGSFFDPLSGPRFIRFSADGYVIVAYMDHSLIVVQASDLTLVRRFTAIGPPNVIPRAHACTAKLRRKTGFEGD
jgi:uncharacterized protein with WD repeat